MIKSKNKKGISQVVSVVIFILLITISIGIVWTSLNNLFTDLSPTFDCTQAKIEQPLRIENACYDSSNVVLTLRRTLSQTEINTIDFTIIFDDKEKLEYYCGADCDKSIILEKGATEEYKFDVGDISPKSIIIGINSCVLVSAEIEESC